jgi:hypothetical protein
MNLVCKSGSGFGGGNEERRWLRVGGNFVSNVDAPVMLRPEVTFKSFFRMAANPVYGSTVLGEEARGRRKEELMIGFAPVSEVMNRIEPINYGFAVRVNR